MDEILYLEPDEEITSVIDKLKKAESHSVGLVIPRNASLIQSIVNLKLLKKEAEKLDKEIALVTTDKIGKNIAGQVGIQVYEDVHAKRPAGGFQPPALPKGDEVIEVNMAESGATGSAPTNQISGAPKVKYYDPPTGGSTAGHPEPTQPPKEKRADNPHAAHLTPTEPLAAMPHLPHHQPGKRGPIVFLSIFIAVILATLLGLPQTSIIVTVAAESFEKSIPLSVEGLRPSRQSADQQLAKDLDPIQPVVPGKLLSITNDDARRVVATGKKDVGTKAKGQVTLSNAWQSEPLRLATGTGLNSSEGKAFTLSSDATIPGVTLELKEGQLVTKAGTVLATLTATEPGESYNVKAGRFSIPSLPTKQQEKVYAESSKDFTGGTSKQVSVMTQADVDGAKSTVVEDLNKQATESLKKDTKNLKLIEEAIVHQVENVETNPAKVDTETDYFDIKVKVKHQVMVFEEKAVQQVVDQALKAEIPEDKELLLGEGDEFVISVTNPDYESERLELESKIKTKIGNRVDPKEAKKGLAGKSESEARNQLSQIPTVIAVAIYPFPSWWWQDISLVPWNTRLRVVYE